MQETLNVVLIWLPRHMEMHSVVMLIIIAVLLFMLAGLMFWGSRRRRISTLTHEADVLAIAEAHRAELDQRDSDRANREAELRAQTESIDGLRAHAVRAAAQGMKWELASRHQLVKACEIAGLDAVVATNIVFTPEEPMDHAFCAQIDHMVVTSNAVLIVESKRWNGVIFDGVRPSDHAAAFSTLFDEDELVPPFAVQLSRPSEGSQLLEWRFDSGRKAPARQARRQAMRFRGLLEARSKAVPYIDTCVFYSHQNSKVISRQFDQEGAARTLIATSGNIHRIIRDVHASKSKRLVDGQAALIIDTVRELGADLVGTGRFADTYQSPVHLDFSTRESKKSVS